MNWYKQAQKNKCSGWIAVRLPKDDASKIQKWGKDNVPDEILYNEDGFGRETDTHITVVYGVCTDKVKIVKALLKDQKPIKATLRDIGFFKSPDKHEPLIIKVKSKDLEDLHKKIKDHLHIETTFNDYKAHCTIAYLKKGKAMKYAGDKTFSGKKIIFNKIVFKNDKNEEIEIKL